MADLGSVLTSQVTVSSTAASQIATGLSDSETGVVVKAMAVNGATNVYIGGASTVTTSTGYELAAGNSLLIPVQNIDELWAITTAGTPKVCFLVQ